MSALILLAVVLLVVAAAVPLAHRQMRREVRRASARQSFDEQMVILRAAFEDMAVAIGTALMPAMRGLTQAAARLGAAFTAPPKDPR